MRIDADDPGPRDRCLARDRARRWRGRWRPAAPRSGSPRARASELEALARELGDRAHALAVRRRRRATQVAAAVDGFARAAGGLDLVVANAGIAHYGPFPTQDLERREAMTRVNWLGTVYTVHAALPHLIDRGARPHRRRVLRRGLRAFPWAAAYGATKSAQRGFAEALRHELAGTGVSVTTVFPGEIATHLHAHEKATMPGLVPRRRRGGRRRRLAPRSCAAVERTAARSYYPRQIRLLGLNGIAPRLSDAILRRLRGGTAAPRRD